LSKDTFSKNWINAKTNKWIENYVNKVSLHEPFVHCLRNRYFLELITRLHKEDKIDILINLGSGFSMYPFLLDESLVHIEVDQSKLMTYKKEQIDKWIQNGTLPNRNIQYLQTNLNEPKDKLQDELLKIVGTKRTFILLEGVIFFLTEKDTIEVLELGSQIQKQGDLFGCVSFQNQITGTDCFKRLIRFYEEEVNLNEKFKYLTLPSKFYKSLHSYKLKDHQDYTTLSKKYAPQREITNPNLILNENMYILERK